MAARDIIGIDFPPGRVLLAVVGDSAGGPAVRHAVSRDLPEGADATTTAALLRQMLEETATGVRQAVLAVPAGRGFIQPADEEVQAPDSEYASASWTTGSGRTMQAVAARTDVSWLQEVAAQAGLAVRAVTLRSLACLAALDFIDPAADGTCMGVVLGRNVASLLALRDGEILVAHSRQITERPGADRHEVAATVVEQMVRLALTTFGQTGSIHLWLIADAADAPIAQTLPERLGMPVEVRRPAQEADTDLGPAREQAGQFAPAIGLALQGLTHVYSGEATRGLSVNLLETDRPAARGVGWRFVTAAAAALVGLLIVVWAATAVGRYRELQELREARQSLADQRSENEAVLEQWRSIRGWVATPAGRRREVSTVCNRLQQLLPDAAYVTSLSFGRRSDGPPVVQLEGRAISAQSLYDFVSRLEDSPMFSEASLGAVTELPAEDEFVRRFNMTVELQE